MRIDFPNILNYGGKIRWMIIFKSLITQAVIDLSASFIHCWKAILMLNLKYKLFQDELLLDFEKIDGIFRIFL